jgi:hypothetical protein
MNDDEKFFKRFQEELPSEFTTSLYKRITLPMNTQTKTRSFRQVGLVFAIAFALLIASIWVYPPTRAMAYSLLRQIGAFTFTNELPQHQEPTLPPPDPNHQLVTASSAQDASQLVGFTVLAPQSLPAGFAQEGLLSIQPNGNGRTVISSYANEAMDQFILINQYQYQAGDSYTDIVAGEEQLRDVEVRGNSGVWITGRMMVNPFDNEHSTILLSSNWLYWEENGIVYTIMSYGFDLQEILQLADNLK